MKKLIFTAAVLFSSIFISCNHKEGGISSATQKNLDAMHGITKCFDTKDFSKLGDYIAEDAVDHGGEKDVKGVANMKIEFEKMVGGYENSKTEIVKELADDEYVMTWQRYSGTLKTDQMGLKAGEKFNSAALEVAKFKDGKAIEHWTFMQPNDVMKMMMSNAQPVIPADSTKTK